MNTKGRVTIPTDMDAVPETLALLKRWGADAIRDCDGTEFPQELKDAGAKILRHLLHYPQGQRIGPKLTPMKPSSATL